MSLSTRSHRLPWHSGSLSLGIGSSLALTQSTFLSPHRREALHSARSEGVSRPVTAAVFVPLNYRAASSRVSRTADPVPWIGCAGEPTLEPDSTTGARTIAQNTKHAVPENTDIRLGADGSISTGLESVDLTMDAMELPRLGDSALNPSYTPPDEYHELTDRAASPLLNHSFCLRSMIEHDRKFLLELATARKKLQVQGMDPYDLDHLPCSTRPQCPCPSPPPDPSPRPDPHDLPQICVTPPTTKPMRCMTTRRWDVRTTPRLRALSDWASSSGTPICSSGQTLNPFSTTNLVNGLDSHRLKGSQIQTVEGKQVSNKPLLQHLHQNSKLATDTSPVNFPEELPSVDFANFLSGSVHQLQPTQRRPPRHTLHRTNSHQPNGADHNAPISISGVSREKPSHTHHSDSIKDRLTSPPSSSTDNELADLDPNPSDPVSSQFNRAYGRNRSLRLRATTPSPKIYGTVRRKADLDPIYSDPIAGAPQPFQSRLAEISSLEVETIKWERSKRFKKKPFSHD